MDEWIQEVDGRWIMEEGRWKMGGGRLRRKARDDLTTDQARQMTGAGIYTYICVRNIHTRRKLVRGVACCGVAGMLCYGVVRCGVWCNDEC